MLVYPPYFIELIAGQIILLWSACSEAGTVRAAPRWPTAGSGRSQISVLQNVSRKKMGEHHCPSRGQICI